MMLAFRLDAAVLAATANVAGSGEWLSSSATRTVTSYLLGGLSMTGTIGDGGKCEKICRSRQLTIEATIQL